MVNNFDVCYYDDIAIHFDVASYVITHSHFVTAMSNCCLLVRLFILQGSGLW